MENFENGYHGDPKEDITGTGVIKGSRFIDPNNPEHFTDNSMEDQFDSIGLREILGKEDGFENLVLDSEAAATQEHFIHDAESEEIKYTDLDPEQEHKLRRQILLALEGGDNSLPSTNMPQEHKNDISMQPAHESIHPWVNGIPESNLKFPAKMKRGSYGGGGYQGKDNLKTMSQSQHQRMNRKEIGETYDKELENYHAQEKYDYEPLDPENTLINEGYRKIQEEAENEE